MTPNQSKSFSSTDRTGGLHAAIMNLPCKVQDDAEEDDELYAYWVRGYLNGHRDARHAAAELALQSDAINAELLEAAHEALVELYRLSPSLAAPKLRAAIEKATA